MKNTMWAVGVSLAMGLVVGCGGGVSDETAQESSTESRQDALPDCSSGGILNDYYSDATYTTLIGERGCSCGYYISWGKSSVYRQSYDSCQ